MKNKNVIDKFLLENEVIVITGAAGLLGEMHAETVLEAGGKVVLLDINSKVLNSKVKTLSEIFGNNVIGLSCDITNKVQLKNTLNTVLDKFGKVTGLINNAANDPKVSNEINSKLLTRFENFPLEKWGKDIEVGLTGAFLCSQVFGYYMATNKKGVIINIASDLSVIAPDQRLYEIQGVPEDSQPTKPISYSVIKTGIIGLTRYLATYWAKSNIRVNAISPGGVFNNQDKIFIDKLEQRIPMQRMANKDEYKGSILYLLSNASNYLTGFNLVVDGGRSCW